ncbi:MAG: hypothetical protein RBS80_02710 [Thermoguttaceae bacterium]|jgi:hypothetical protein|nr:hypothetical protein [Thermoguttaceae bacterium]
MDGTQPVAKTWFIRIAPAEVQVRCAFQRVKNRIVQFTVQLEIFYQDKWIPVVRYDNAHGFCHRDTLHPDGSQEKTGLFAGGMNETFTYAIEDLRTNWKAYHARYLGEAET